MPEKTLEQALDAMTALGFCLWIGGGVSMHLASIGRRNPTLMGWTGLTEAALKESGVTPPKVLLSAAEKLGIAEYVLGRQRFQRFLRETVHEGLRDAIINAAEDRHGATSLDECVPDQFADLVRLGTIASPIVNFNIETWTTDAVAMERGPYFVHCLSLPAWRDLIKYSYKHRLFDNRFPRRIYHPHGALGVSELCIMSPSDYKALRGTLAYQLAVHQAFQSQLAIVGMSLNDEYLRKHISDFRDQIARVFWFTNEQVDASTERWTWASGIEIIRVADDWKDFWQAISKRWSDRDTCGFAYSWHHVVMQAYADRDTGYHLIQSLRRLVADDAPDERIEPLRAACAFVGLDVPKDLSPKELSEQGQKVSNGIKELATQIFQKESRSWPPMTS